MNQCLRGLGASLGIVTGYVPVAIAFGVSALAAGLSPWLATAVFASASRFTLIGVLAPGASPLSAAGLATSEQCCPAD